MFGKGITFVMTVAFSAGLLATETAYGQACLGVPIPQGSYSAQGDVSFVDGSTTYGASGTGNLTGRLWVGAGYGFTNADGAANAHNFSGRVAFDLAGLPLSPCPMTEFRYSRVSVSDEFSSSVGIGLVKRFQALRNVTVAPYLTPQLLVRSASGAEGEAQQHGPEQFSPGEHTNDIGFGVRKGVAVGIRRFFGALNVELSSLEGSGTVAGISFGMRF